MTAFRKRGLRPLCAAFSASCICTNVAYSGLVTLSSVSNRQGHRRRRRTVESRSDRNQGRKTDGEVNDKEGRMLGSYLWLVVRRRKNSGPVASATRSSAKKIALQIAAAGCSADAST